MQEVPWDVQNFKSAWIWQIQDKFECNIKIDMQN